MSVVADASVVVAALVDSGEVGSWAESVLLSGPVLAPHIMPVEAANVLRRSALAGLVPEEVAAQAHDDLCSLRVELFPYEPFARRVWELRANVTAYDACYVALAEELQSRLATLDRKLAAAPGPACRFWLPPS